MARGFLRSRLDIDDGGDDHDHDHDHDRASAPRAPAGPGNRNGPQHEERSIRTPSPRLFPSPLCSTSLAAGANRFSLETRPPQRYAHGLQPVKTDAQRPHPRCDHSFLRPWRDSDQLVDAHPLLRHERQQRPRRRQGRVLELWRHTYAALASRSQRRTQLQRLWALLQAGTCSFSNVLLCVST